MVLLKFIISGWGAVKPYNRGYPVRNKSADRGLGTFFDIYLHKNVSKEANRRSCVSAVEGGCERTLSLHLRPLKLINMGTASTVLQLTLMLHFVYALLCNRWLFPCILRPIFPNMRFLLFTHRGLTRPLWSMLTQDEGRRKAAFSRWTRIKWRQNAVRGFRDPAGKVPVAFISVFCI